MIGSLIGFGNRCMQYENWFLMIFAVFGIDCLIKVAVVEGEFDSLIFWYNTALASI